MSSYVSTAFYAGQDAEDAIEALIALGYPSEKIDVIMSPETHGRYVRGSAPGESNGANVSRDEPRGEVLGATLGAIVGGVAATGAIAVTVSTGGLAFPFIVGPLAAVLGAGGAGAAVGGLIAALVRTGVPSDHAKRLAHDVDAGAIAVGVAARDEDVERVRSILPEIKTAASA